jgi:hypothetical protein
MDKASVVVLDVKAQTFGPNSGLYRQSSQKMLNLSCLDIFEFCFGLGKFSTNPRVKFSQGHPGKNLWSF